MYVFNSLLRGFIETYLNLFSVNLSSLKNEICVGFRKHSTYTVLTKTDF